MKGRANRAKKLTAGIAACVLALSLSPAPALAYAHATLFEPSYEAEPADWDDYLGPIDYAGAMVEQQDWSVGAEVVPDVAALRTWLEARLEAMELPDVILHVKLNATEVVPAVNGTAEAPEGVAGSFKAEIEINRSIIGLVSKHVPISGIIFPVPYVAPPQPDLTPTQQAGQQIEQAILAQIADDPEAWTVEPDALGDIAADDVESTKVSVRSWVDAKVAPLVPVGFSHEVGEPDIVLPTEEDEGSFVCPIYLEEAQEDEADGEEQTHAAATGQPHSLMMRSARTATMEPSREPTLLIKGKIAPRAVKVPSEPDDPDTPPDGDQNLQPDDGNGDSNGSQGSEEPKDNRKPIHPLALRTMDPAPDIMNTATQLDRSRVVKRPNQIGGEEAPASMSSTTVQRGSSIAPTSDASQSTTAAGITICIIALAVIAVCIWQLRHKTHER